MPWFSMVFTRGCFDQILNYLHLANYQNAPSKDSSDYKLHKFGIIPSILNENFESLIHSVRGKEAQKIWDKSLGFMWIQNWILLKFQIYKEKDENKAE